MMLLLTAMTIYAVGYAFELLSDDLAATRFWLRIEIERANREVARWSPRSTRSCSPSDVRKAALPVR